jgi:hypothetical protein
MIYETNEPFDFKKNITFLSPKSLTGGNYFIRCYSPNQNPLYIQSPKCKSKQKIVKSGKKMYCDLVFSHFDESFLKWIEDFEILCQQNLFENRSQWFDSELEMHDIENSFAASFKVYQSGKQHVLRANIPIRLGKCGLKIYDEMEQEIDADTIVENTPLITILEIQGIRCSSRNFQLEYEVKQMMVLNPVDLFDKCILSKHKPDTTNTKTISNYVSVPESDKTTTEPLLAENVCLVQTNENIKKEEGVITGLEEEIDELEENMDLDLGIKEEKEDICEMEITLPLEDTKEEILQLKKRNDVYYEMYKEAKKKAKLAREFALSAYLEAKRIKNTYLIDEVFDSDDEDVDLDSDLKELENDTLEK